MQPKGGMNATLFPFYIRHFILPSYPFIQKETVRNPVTSSKIKGPLIIKTDNRLERLSKVLKHIEFHKALMEMAIHILLRLPYGTESTQEMDHGFTLYEPACIASTICVAAKKMAAPVAARKKMRERKHANQPEEESINNNDATSKVANLHEFLKEQGDKDNDEEDFEFEVKWSACNIKIDNNNLSAIVNGFPGDPVELRPFNSIFTWQNIWKWWCKVGFIPMTFNALNNEKVRQQLGGATAAVGSNRRKIELLYNDYERIALEIMTLGFMGSQNLSKLFKMNMSW